MALFWYSLTDKGMVNLCEVASKLSIDVKKLEEEMERQDKALERNYRGYEPPADASHIEEIGRQMRQRPKYGKRPPG